MADLRHQAVAQLFRDNDELAPYLVAARGELVRAGKPVRHDSDLSTIDHGLELPIPMHKEARADVVTILNDTGAVSQVIITEPQTARPDKQKWFSWVIYVGVAGYTFQCEVTLLVLPLTDDAARACHLDFATGPNFQVRLIVVDRLATPHPDALGGEACVVQVTMLSVLNGAFDLTDPETRRYVVAKLSGAGRIGKTYTRVVWHLADPDVRKYLEDDMNLADLRVPFLDDPVDEALAKGEAIGEARGEARGEAKLLRRIIQTRGFSMTSMYQSMVEDCTDLEQFETWAERAVTAKTIDDIFRS